MRKEGAWCIMKRAPADTPNLDDILARDFAELKVGEANLAPEEPPKDEKAKQTTASVPKVYNQRIDAVEERTSFDVKPPEENGDCPRPSQSSGFPTAPGPESPQCSTRRRL